MTAPSGAANDKGRERHARENGCIRAASRHANMVPGCSGSHAFPQKDEREKPGESGHGPNP
jgi:hypothetical protein